MIYVNKFEECNLVKRGCSPRNELSVMRGGSPPEKDSPMLESLGAQR